VSEWLIDNVRVLQPGHGLLGDRLRVRDGTIVEAGGGPATEPAAPVTRFDGGGRLLTPGLIDLHAHAIERYAYEASPDALIAATAKLARYGTTCVLPTLYNVLTPETLDRLAALGTALESVSDVAVPGFHLEGPFLALAGAVAETREVDLGLLDELLAAAGRVAAMSLSPEKPGVLAVIERLRDRDVVPFITHTAAGVAETQAAIDAGARHATHFYDVFPAPPVTEPGVRPAGAVEAILADPRCTVDVIADGVHVDPAAIRMAVAAKGPRGVALITDASVGAGLPPGRYSLPGGSAIRVAFGDAARIAEPDSPNFGVLAGSSLTMDRGVANLLRWLDLPIEQVWAMGTATPAGVLGRGGKGTIRPGADADLVLWDEADGRLRAVRTWVGGRCVYQR